MPIDDQTTVAGTIASGIAVISFAAWKLWTVASKDKAGLDMLQENAATRKDLRERIVALEKQNDDLGKTLLKIVSEHSAATTKVSLLEQRVEHLERELSSAEKERDAAIEDVLAAERFLESIGLVLVKTQGFLETCIENECPGGDNRKRARTSLATLVSQISERIANRQSRVHHG